MNLRRLLPVAGVLLIMLIAAALIPTLAILVAIIWPPEAPLPPSVRTISREQPAPGVIHALYSADSSPCDAYRFFQAAGATCTSAFGQCDGEPDDTLYVDVGSHLARCHVVVPFSIFEMYWEVNIGYGDAQGTSSLLRVDSEVSWLGRVAPPMETLIE
jgi:hypothetical protein